MHQISRSEEILEDLLARAIECSSRVCSQRGFDVLIVKPDRDPLQLFVA